jgi:cysteine-S-conjugate beta-lyase
MRAHTLLARAAGLELDPYRATSVPLYQTATFAQPTPEGGGAYDYSRSGNPTRAVLERELARLDGGARALAYTSGMAALSAVLRLLPPGAAVVAGDDLYGGSHRLLTRIGQRQGLRVHFADTCDSTAVAAAWPDGAGLLLVETPGNPKLSICDLRALSELAHARGALLAVDGSLMSPWLQRPLEHGADLVVHSATKHLCGHGDATAGVVVARDAALAAELAFLQNAEGTALAPFEAWLVLRGLATLGVRLERAQASAQAVARFLAGHPRVRRVFYPGLAAHPGHDLHARQARGPGSVLSFQVGDGCVAREVVAAVGLFTIAVSFGSTRSAISLPCSMSHAAIPAAELTRRGLGPDLVRLSIGLEDPQDLIEDLDRALTA